MFFVSNRSGGRKSLRDGGGGRVKISGLGEITDLGEGSYFYWGVSTPLHVMVYIETSGMKWVKKKTT